MVIPPSVHRICCRAGKGKGYTQGNFSVPITAENYEVIKVRGLGIIRSVLIALFAGRRTAGQEAVDANRSRDLAEFCFCSCSGPGGRLRIRR